MVCSPSRKIIDFVIHERDIPAYVNAYRSAPFLLEGPGRCWLENACQCQQPSDAGGGEHIKYRIAKSAVGEYRTVFRLAPQDAVAWHDCARLLADASSHLQNRVSHSFRPLLHDGAALWVDHIDGSRSRWLEMQSSSRRNCESFDWCQIGDQKECFDRIGHDMLRDSIHRTFRDQFTGNAQTLSNVEQTVRCLLRGLSDGRGIPQGSSASFLFAEIFNLPISQFCIANSMSADMYMDELRIYGSSAHDVLRKYDQIELVMAPRGMEWNPKKAKRLRCERLAEGITRFQALIEFYKQLTSSCSRQNVIEATRLLIQEFQTGGVSVNWVRFMVGCILRDVGMISDPDTDIVSAVLDCYRIDSRHFGDAVERWAPVLSHLAKHPLIQDLLAELALVNPPSLDSSIASVYGCIVNAGTFGSTTLQQSVRARLELDATIPLNDALGCRATRAGTALMAALTLGASEDLLASQAMTNYASHPEGRRFAIVAATCVSSGLASELWAHLQDACSSPEDRFAIEYFRRKGDTGLGGQSPQTSYDM